MHCMWPGNDPAVHMERMATTDVSHDGAQQFDFAGPDRYAPVQQVDGEKPTADRVPGAAIVGHGFASLALVRRNALRLLRPTILPTSGRFADLGPLCRYSSNGAIACLPFPFKTSST